MTNRDSANRGDLLPCPFCGPGQSVVSLWFDDVAGRFRVGCGRCGCSTGIHPRDTTEAPAIASWNTRANVERVLAESREALESSRVINDKAVQRRCQMDDEIERLREGWLAATTPSAMCNFRRLAWKLTCIACGLRLTRRWPYRSRPNDRGNYRFAESRGGVYRTGPRAGIGDFLPNRQVEVARSDAPGIDAH